MSPWCVFAVFSPGFLGGYSGYMMFFIFFRLKAPPCGGSFFCGFWNKVNACDYGSRSFFHNPMLAFQGD